MQSFYKRKVPSCATLNYQLMFEEANVKNESNFLKLGWNSLLLFIVVFVSLFSLSLNSYAQCDASAFTATPTNGICTQDGSISVAIPGIQNCVLTATLRPTGASPSADVVMNLSSTGTGQFSNLKSGTYEVRVQQGAFIHGPKTVTIVNSYLGLNVQTTATGTKCPSTAASYTPNGSVKVNFTGGNGPYALTLTGPGGPYTVNMATTGSHTFTGLAPGNYSASVTDQSATCKSNETRSASVTAATWLPVSVVLNRLLIDPATCGRYLRIDVSEGNRNAILANPSLATYTINGVTKNFIVGSMPASGNYWLRTESGVPDDTDISYSISDGCSTVTDVVNSKKKLQEFFVTAENIVSDANCNKVYELVYHTRTGGSSLNKKSISYWHFSAGNNTGVSYYYESPVNSNNWIFIEKISYSGAMAGAQTMQNWQTPHTNTRIKLVFEDQGGCNTYERIVDARNGVNVNQLNNMRAREISGVLEGTSSFELYNITGGATGGWTQSHSFNFPLSFSIARVDGQQSMVVNASQPYDLAGSYTINFPYTYSFSGSSSDYLAGQMPTFGDLPLGNYVVTITDACGYSVQQTVSLTKPAGYNPKVSYELGCAKSNVLFDMGQNANTQKNGRVYLHKSTNGSVGVMVNDYDATQLLKGSFSNIEPGDYFIYFKQVNYDARVVLTNNPRSALSTRSVARNISGVDQQYKVAITVAPYVKLEFSTTSLFCNPNDQTSGTIGVSVSGIPVDFINYKIWPKSANPDVDLPLQQHNTTTLTEKDHVFNGLTAGIYIIRVATACGYTEQEITLSAGAPLLPEPQAEPPVVCLGESTTLSMPLSPALFDVTWKDAAGTTIGTGVTVTVSPSVQTTYTALYSLKPTLACSNVVVNSKSITIDVNSEAANVNAGPDQALPGIVFKLAASQLNTQSATGTWTVLSVNDKDGIALDLSTVTIVNPNEYNSSVTIPVRSTASLIWTVTSGNCNGSDNVILTSLDFIDAVNDDRSASPVNGFTGSINVINVLTNDILNGATGINPSDVTITVVTGATPATAGANVPALNTATGAVDVPAKTPAGTYFITYRICTVNGACDNALITVIVNAPVIDAVNDTNFPAINGKTGGNTPSVLGNDLLNGVKVVPAEVKLTSGTSPNTGLSMNLDGSITVSPNTPAGTYKYPYTICEIINPAICEIINPANCDNAEATVIVNAPVIDAVNDTNFPVINGKNGGNTPSVLGNDLLNGVKVVPVEVKLTSGTSPNAGLSMNADGTITVLPNTPAGTYKYPYTICEVANLSNCDNAEATVVVITPLLAVNDAAVYVPETAVPINVLANDIPGSTAIDKTSVKQVTPPANGIIAIDPVTGVITYTPNTGYIGSDSFVYSVMDQGGNLSTAIVTITPRLQGSISVSKVADVQTVSKVGAIINYSITVKNTGNVGLKDVKILDPLTGLDRLVAALAVNEERMFTTTYTVKLSDMNLLKITNVATVTAKDLAGNDVNGSGSVDVAIIKIPLHVPNVITPNGDNRNDVFIIDGLDLYPENTLSIFNRWGNEVYRSNGAYQQNWTGEGLNGGTYYYLLKVKDQSGNWKVLKGWLTLFKTN